LYGIKPKGVITMARIDIRDLDDETLQQLDEQSKKYGINSRADYIRLLIKMDILTNIVQKIRNEENAR
jgi:metal-responsive CopG/Arc/MetJ family transcriptional regulator